MIGLREVVIFVTCFSLTCIVFRGIAMVPRRPKQWLSSRSQSATNLEELLRLIAERKKYAQALIDIYHGDDAILRVTHMDQATCVAVISAKLDKLDKCIEQFSVEKRP